MRGKLWFSAATAALLMAGIVPASAQDADPPGDASTRATFAAGQTVDGAFEPVADVDWYRMHVEAGQRYSFTLDGVAGADGNAVDPMITLYSADGEQLAANDDANGSLNSALQYIPSTSGDIFVEARAFADAAAGPYRLSATAAAVPPDDAGNDATTRARVAPGRAVTGNIEYEGDVDWYRMSVRTGQRYHVTLVGGEGRLTDPFLRVLDAEGNELAINDDAEDLNSALDFVPRANGDVFIEARAFSDAYSGGYTLNVTTERLPRDSVSGDRNTRGRIALGGTVNGSLDFPTDTDWYRIRLGANESVRISLNSAGDTPLSDPYLHVYDASGTEVASDDDSGGNLNSYLEFTPTSAGTYFISAEPYGGESTGGYALSVRGGDIPADSSTDMSLSAAGDYREGVLAPAGDRDWYKLDLEAGQELRIMVNSAEGNGDPLGDPYVVVYGPDSAELARDDDGGDGLNSLLEFQAATAGTYFVEVRGFSEDAAGRYAVIIAPGEIGNTFDTAEGIIPGMEGRVSNIGAPDDVDWFGLELIEGRSYRFYVDGVGNDTGEGALVDPYLTLFDAQGNQVAFDDDGGAGLNAFLSFASPTGGPYFAAVSSYGSTGTGRYAIRVVDTEVPGNIYTDENLDGTNDSRFSSIEMPGDLDNYRVSLEANARYVIEVVGQGDHPLSDPFLNVLDGEGNSVVSDDDGGDGLDSRLRFTPSQSGEYYIQASGLGGSTGSYQIRIVRQ